ncbi:ABC transporter permease subunit [Amycolatopsis roodepoortensis]|uniref:ABC transporter permease n=1 Tax=Amycolatopsis roodepoortensis TaxID=700274 RepID=UPI00214C543E|nr:ABC transporter permease subunit [Amycolatopsis roodepoortensis]UUV30844.1 ABC transporter permease subunit [Amycolatopsis roodepoortensis]
MVKRMLGWSLLAVPLALAMAGPVIAGPVESVGAPWQTPDGTHPLGTDVLGRDALTVILAGGFPVIGMTAAALGLAYLIGVPLGLVAAGRGRLADETVMRSLDLVLAFPSLLVLMVLAATGHRGPGVLIPVVAVLQLPAITRVVRAAALAPGCRTAVEALTLQGQLWWRIQLGYVARHLAGPVATDAGTRLGVVLYLLASANFLGLGLPADSPDWAVVIERNSEALYTSPAVVLVPAALLMALCVGTNLVADRLLAARRVIP